MADGQLEWPIPVVTFADRRPLYLTVAVMDGEVVAKAPPVPFVMSPTSKQLLIEALDEAFARAQDMDQGIT